MNDSRILSPKQCFADILSTNSLAIGQFPTTSPPPIKINVLGVGEIAQRVKCLPYKNKGLSLIPSTNKKTPGVVVHMLVITVLGKLRREDC